MTYRMNCTQSVKICQVRNFQAESSNSIGIVTQHCSLGKTLDYSADEMTSLDLKFQLLLAIDK